MRGLSTLQQELYKYIQTKMTPETTAKQVCSDLGWNRANMYQCLNALEKKGYIKRKPTNFGKTIKEV